MSTKWQGSFWSVKIPNIVILFSKALKKTKKNNKLLNQQKKPPFTKQEKHTRPQVPTFFS